MSIFLGKAHDASDRDARGLQADDGGGTPRVGRDRAADGGMEGTAQNAGGGVAVHWRAERERRRDERGDTGGVEGGRENNVFELILKIKKIQFESV